jgi:hypothetical protein
MSERSDIVKGRWDIKVDEVSPGVERADDDWYLCDQLSGAIGIGWTVAAASGARRRARPI